MRAFHDARRLSGFLGLTVAIWSLDAVGDGDRRRRRSACRCRCPVAFLLIAGLGLGSALPSTPGYVGIYQFVAVTVLTPFGFSRTDAIAYILRRAGADATSSSDSGVAVGLWRYRDARRADTSGRARATARAASATASDEISRVRAMKPRRVVDEADLVTPLRQPNPADRQVGAIDRRRLAVDLRRPARDSRCRRAAGYPFRRRVGVDDQLRASLARDDGRARAARRRVTSEFVGRSDAAIRGVLEQQISRSGSKRGSSSRARGSALGGDAARRRTKRTRAEPRTR